MKLSIHTINKTLFEGEIAKLITRTSTGEITVLNNHAPLISVVQGPSLTIIDNDENNHTIELTSGFLEVSPENETVILVDQS